MKSLNLFFLFIILFSYSVVSKITYDKYNLSFIDDKGKELKGYIEMPKQYQINVHGTEYIEGDNGKMFLQFLDNNLIAVNDSECFLKVYYPNGTVFLNDSLMFHLDNSIDGIYYRDFLVPSQDGVYPASAKCYRPLIFHTMTTENYITEGFESNSWTGGYNWFGTTWDYDLASIVTNTTAGTGGCYRGNYCALYTGSYGFIERGLTIPYSVSAINITFSHKFSGFVAGTYMQFFIFDGNWYEIANYTTASYSNDVWYRESYILNASQYRLDTILLGFYTISSGTNRKMYVDTINISTYGENVTFTNITDYQLLRGSGEIHVSKAFNKLNNSIGNINISFNPNITILNNITFNVTNVTLSCNQSNISYNLSCNQNISVNITTNGTNISNIENKVNDIWGDIRMIAYILLLIINLYLSVFSLKFDFVWTFFNSILSLVLILIFWPIIQILSYLCIVILIYNIINMYSISKRS